MRFFVHTRYQSRGTTQVPVVPPKGRNTVHQRPVLARVSLAAMAITIAFSSACSRDDGGDSSTEADSTEAAAAATDDPNAPPADPASFPNVVATVNDTEIRKPELMERVASIAAQMPPSEDTTSTAFFRRVLEEIVGGELLYQASRDRSLTVGAVEIEQQLSTMRSRFPDPARFEQALAQQGLTLDALKTQMERDMSIQKFIEADVTPQVSVSEDAKRAFYDENPERMRQPDRLRLSHVLKLVEPGAPPEAKAAARSELEGVLAEAQGGADFAALARDHSEDPGSAANGGELVVRRGETVPPFEEAAFALSAGELSPIVETQFGFHIIKLSEKIEGELVPYEQMEPRIEGYLRQQAVQEEIDRTVESLKADARIELFI